MGFLKRLLGFGSFAEVTFKIVPEHSPSGDQHPKQSQSIK
jgi:hypothetical protein